ncbi:unnamed protein product, partial [marine sediment metagenome]
NECYFFGNINNVRNKATKKMVNDENVLISFFLSKALTFVFNTSFVFLCINLKISNATKNRVTLPSMYKEGTLVKIL